jgi:phosphoenolpyruvate carboxylase
MKRAAHDLPEELRSLVKWSVALFGDVLREKLGEKAYARIESVRRRMAKIRTSSPAATARELESVYAILEKLGSDDRRAFARSYTLMFELMNTCENAYRTHRLRQRGSTPEKDPQFSASTIFYVLTAHPTEARAPANIEIFHRVQQVLVAALAREGADGFAAFEAQLRPLLEIAWNVRIVRYRKPRVEDEAEHLYSVTLRDENLSLMLDFTREHIPIYLRSWVGGDKDGHPGVDEKAMQGSLQLSRDFLFRYAERRVADTLALTELFETSVRYRQAFRRYREALRALKKLRAGDGRKIEVATKLLHEWLELYRREVGELPLPLIRLARLFRSFPGLVIPLELREDSAVLLSDPSGKKIAIGRMLRLLRKIAGGRDVRWYARGMIISMADSAEQIRVVARMMRKNLGDSRVRVVPLFEQRAALEKGHEVLAQVFRDPELKKFLRNQWGSRFEIMVGYSDSSKESGVLKSRLAVVKAMGKIDAACRRAKVDPIFFHGSGGSIDRGGGSVEEQMAPWPKSALEHYKATIQGEMVERTFASPEMAASRFWKIALGGRAEGTAPSARRTAPKPSAELDAFANRVAKHYSDTIASPRFLSMVERATPYRYLSALKIGSRPSKRGGSLSVPALRAIPWVLCWTQSRVLFQTWWGIGTAWEQATPTERAKLRREFARNSSFRSFVQALGFTLAKVELPIWEFYLSRSGLDAKEVASFREEFRRELAGTHAFFRGITGKSDPLWFRPWLGRSIELRASMIHPLNLLEILAQQDRDLPLLRICVTGIASGMLTTG